MCNDGVLEGIGSWYLVAIDLRVLMSFKGFNSANGPKKAKNGVCGLLTGSS